MSLRDDLLEQKSKKKAQQEAITEQHAKLEQQRREKEQHEAKLREDDAADRFNKLKSDVESGNPPAEWLRLYEKYVNKIKIELSGENDEFSFVDTVSKEYYEQKEAIHSGKESERTLLNGFISQKLKDEGFQNVVFELRCRTERYSTPEDYESQSRRQEEYDSQASAKYYADVEKFNNGGYLDMDTPNSTDKAYRPKQASLSKSGIRYHYEIVASGSLYKFNKQKKAKASGMSNLIFLPLILGALGFAGGFYFYVKGGLFGKDIGALAPFIIAAAGALIGLAVVGIEKCIRMAHVTVADDRNDKNKKVKAILLCATLVLILVAALAAIVGLIVYAVLLTL